MQAHLILMYILLKSFFVILQIFMFNIFYIDIK